VELLNGNSVVGTATNQNGVWKILLSNLPAGNYSFTAKITDNTGAITTSQAMQVSVLGEQISSNSSQYTQTVRTGGDRFLTVISVTIVFLVILGIFLVRQNILKNKIKTENLINDKKQD